MAWPISWSVMSSSPTMAMETSSPLLLVRRPRIRGGRTPTRAPANPRAFTLSCSDFTQASAPIVRCETGTRRMSRFPRLPPPNPPPPPPPAVAKTASTCGISRTIASTSSVSRLACAGVAPGESRTKAPTLPSSTGGRNCVGIPGMREKSPAATSTTAPRMIALWLTVQDAARR